MSRAKSWRRRAAAVLSAATLVALSIDSTALGAAAAFAPAPAVTVDAGPVGIVAGPLDADARPDLAVVTADAASVAVRLGDGRGGFSAAPSVTLPGAGAAIAAGALVPGGGLDLAAVHQTSAVSVLAGSGVGGFAAAAPRASGGMVPQAVAAGDLDGDGNVDLAVANFGSASVAVLRGTGAGAFAAAVPVGVGANPAGLAIGNVGGDARPDLVVANAGAGTVSVLVSDDSGGFAAPLTASVGAEPRAVALADLDADGDLDAAVANRGGDSVTILRGTGTGALVPITTRPAGDAPRAAALADLNGDALPDLVVVNEGDGTLSIFEGVGGGAFGAPQTVAVGSSPRAIAVADLDLDLRPDLAVANAGGATVSILLNATAFPAPTALTGQATGVTQTAAVLTGTVTPRGYLTRYRFRYRVGDGAPIETAEAEVPGLVGTLALSTPVSGLAPGTLYRFRIVATGPFGTSEGQEAELRTPDAPALPPGAVTTPASALTTGTATLNGNVQTRGLATRVRFRFGPTPALGSETPERQIGAGLGEVPVSEAISGLAAGTVYHARLVATGPGGETLGDPVSFTTPTDPARAPGASTGAAGVVGPTEATLAGVVTPRGEVASYRFELGPTPEYGSSTPAKDAGSGTGDLAVGERLTGLQPGTTYHFRLVATSGAGEARGADASFSTPALPTAALAVSRAGIAPRWSRSRLRSRLVLVGTAERDLVASLTLRPRLAAGTGAPSRGLNARLTLAAGPFSRTLRLPGDLRPGAYVLRLTVPGAIEVRRSVVLRPPPEGVVHPAFVSGREGGLSATRLPGRRTELFAHFRFVAAPARGRAIGAVWIDPRGRMAAGEVGKPRNRVVVVSVASGAGLARGRWRCILRVGGRPVAEARVRLV